MKSTSWKLKINLSIFSKTVDQKPSSYMSFKFTMHGWACQLQLGQGTTTACTKKSENHPDSCASAGIETMVGPALRAEFPTDWFDDQANSKCLTSTGKWKKSGITIKLQVIHHQPTVPPLKFPVQARTKIHEFSSGRALQALAAVHFKVWCKMLEFQ